MLDIYLTTYGLIGLVTAITTMRVFPPMEGFKPGLSMRLIAILVFTTLWPILISLAVWYMMLGYLGRNREEIVNSTSREFASAETLSNWQSKPR